MEKLPRPARPLHWVGSSLRDFKAFPPEVQDGFGYDLFLAQTGRHPPSAKPLKGLGNSVVELIRRRLRDAEADDAARRQHAGSK